MKEEKLPLIPLKDPSEFHDALADRKRIRVTVRGRVQGVGFRPTTYRYAKERDLNGWISNTSEGVIVEVEGEIEKVDDFLQELRSAPPPQAEITDLEFHDIPAKHEGTFEILPSITRAEVNTQISPDIATCPECLKELFDSQDRRYSYPFLNCTNCGPRFTIIENIPYDRDKTTMKNFLMCPRCSEEYENPANRRFHAQPNACPECGPGVKLVESQTTRASRGCPEVETEGVDAIRDAVKLLKEGRIVAVKGLGGFHLACDAFNKQAVKTLRNRKYREDKPFGVMAKDIETIKQFCKISLEEEKLLTSWKRPIVLLEKKVRSEANIAEEIAPKNKYLGFMLPYTPLHHLLFSQSLSVLVMTSGNISDEPIAYQNEDALSRLRNIADYFLIHNRDVYIRCDDSVARMFGPTETILRRSRGYVPEPITVPFTFKSEILACGAHLKNTFCLARDNNVFLSHHIGDLENWETLRSFEKGIEHFKALFELEPEIIACDLHPDYLSTRYAEDYSSRSPGNRIVRVQHHHAHIVSCLADNGIDASKYQDRVIGVAFDGTGYGDDGNIWGGEFMIAGFENYERKAHLEYIPLPGGEQAIKEPWRMAAVYLHRAHGKDFLELHIEFLSQLDRKKWAVLEKMIEQKTNCPLTSSMGRLFDAVSSLVRLRDKINYEGQAAIELEQLANQVESPEFTVKNYEYQIIGVKDILIIKPEGIITGIVRDLRARTSPSMISVRFHNTIADIIVVVCKRIREETELNEVVLSGGVFQNMVLLYKAFDELCVEGFKVYVHHKVPTNDGGICLGQAVIANETIK